MKKALFVFFAAFCLDFAWEHAHAALYASYQGGPVTGFILARASFADAFYVAAICFPFLRCPFSWKKAALLFVLGVAVGVSNEWYGLSTLRWSYTKYMPIIPVLSVGLSPAIQLGAVGVAAYFMEEKLFSTGSP